MTVTLATIPRDAAFPTERLEGLETGLVLFAAAWLGKQDAVFLADAGLVCTCVDVRAERLNEMRDVYPGGWEFVEADAFAYSSAWRTAGRRWDAVTVDCPTNLFGWCAQLLPRWCDLARRLVVLGCSPTTELAVPDGWRLVERIDRSDYRGGVQWAVFERQWT